MGHSYHDGLLAGRAPEREVRNPRSGRRMDLFPGAGFPAGTFQTLLVGSARVEAILRDPRVVAATLTGSAPAGSSVAAIAGNEVKKVVLELGERRAVLESFRAHWQAGHAR